jgi:hypothetical protein
MENLFVTDTAGQIISRINLLQPQNTALWGKMNVSQMLAHCQAPLEVALGEKKLKWSLLGKLFGKLAKRNILKEEDLPRNMPTVKSFIVKGERDFEKEKARLIHLVERFVNGGPAGIIQEPHPYFGKMTPEEWGNLNWKHLDHHMKQFGV